MFDLLLDVLGFAYGWTFECFSGHTGRLVIKAVTFGLVDLDLDRWLPCFIAVVVGLLFWGAILIAALLWKCPQLVRHIIQYF